MSPQIFVRSEIPLTILPRQQPNLHQQCLPNIVHTYFNSSIEVFMLS